MGFLRRFFDSQAPRFQEGGSCEKLYPIYEAMDSFLYTPSTVTPGPSHVRDSLDMPKSKRAESVPVPRFVGPRCRQTL